MHFLREATGPIYGSGLKEKTILASFTNFHFAINAKDKSKQTNKQNMPPPPQKKKHKNKNSTEREKNFLSLTPLRSIFHNIQFEKLDRIWFMVYMY